MIHYQLQCDSNHGFDGWFKDSGSFDHQVQLGLVACPLCNSVTVRRALMAPAVSRGSRYRQDAMPREDVVSPQDTGTPTTLPVVVPPASESGKGAQAPDRIISLLQRLRTEVEKTCDYVGPSFAEEARRIHYGESEARGIYGEATSAEAEALADEGITFGVVPWLRRSDS